MAPKFHSTDIVPGFRTNWIFTDQGWVEIPKCHKIKEVNKYFSPAMGLMDLAYQVYWALSSHMDKRYLVLFDGLGWSCQCDGYGWRGKCTHISNVKTNFL
jgi:hypothetical protein